MTIFIISFQLIIVILFMPLSALPEIPAHHVYPPYGYVSDEILVKFYAGKRSSALKHIQKNRNIEKLHYFRFVGVDHLRLPDDISVEEALVIFNSDPNVIYAEPNYYRSTEAIPYDENFPLLWGLNNVGQYINGTAATIDADIDAPEAWDITTGNDEIVIAVIDSGLDFSHPDIAPNVWSNPGEIEGNGVDDDDNGYVDDIHGWDFVNDDNAPSANDASGHGTHITGTIAAANNGSPNAIEGTGITGVSFHSQILSLRTLNAYGTGDTADAILAFEYATAIGVDIINCSWGGAGYSQGLKDAIEASSALVVCAAGNNGANNDTSPHYPASYDSNNIVTVAASSYDDNLASFSNFGTISVDLAAPGVDIYSCTPGRTILWSDNFDDGSISDWYSGGPNNDWDLTDLESFSTSYSLTDSADGDYSQRTNSWIRLPALDLAGTRNSRLEFKIKGRSESNFDTLQVEVSTDGSVWFLQPVKLAGIGIVNAISGTITDWTDGLVDLSPYDGSSNLFVRYSFITDWTNNYDGWYIDDVKISIASDSYNGNEYRYLSGTSMAVPHVVGTAALIKAEKPFLSTSDIKAIIIGTVDIKSPMGTLLASNGRLNAFNAVSIKDGGLLLFAASDYNINESVSSVIMSVDRAGSSYGNVSVAYNVTGGSAVAKEDYIETSGVLFWEDGDNSPKSFSIKIVNDTEIESSETLEISLTDATGGAALGIPSKSILTIFDDDAPGAIGNSNFWLLFLPVILGNN